MRRSKRGDDRVQCLAASSPRAATRGLDAAKHYGVGLDQRNDTGRLPDAEEHRLIRAAQQGDRQAFARLVERYWDPLFRWLYHLAHDRHTAEDLAQEAFLKALNGLHTFRLGTNFRAWLFRIAHNTFANHRRSSRPRQPFPEDLPAGDEGPVERALS